MFPPLKWPCYSDKLESQVGAVCVFCTRHCVPDWKPNCVGSGPKEGACWGGRGAAWVLTPKPAHFQKHLPSAVGRRGVVLKAPHRATHSQSTRGPQPCAFWFPGRVPHQQSPCLPAPPPTFLNCREAPGWEREQLVATMTSPGNSWIAWWVCLWTLLGQAECKNHPPPPSPS